MELRVRRTAPPDRNRHMSMSHEPNQPNGETKSVEILSTKDGYDRWAAVYDDDGNPLVALEEPLVDQLLPDVNGLHIADVGCGTGRHTMRLASRGARVIGIDFSEEMLRRARVKA